MWRLALLCLAACGRIYFDPRTDATTDTTPDACAFGPWSTPVQVPGLATSNSDDGPALHPDTTVIVFTSNRNGGVGAEDLWVAFATGPLQFGPPTALAGFNSTANDFGAAWASNDELYFSSAASGNGRVYRASYSNQNFGAPELISELAATTVDGPTITADGLEMFYGDGTTKLGRATRIAQDAPWQVMASAIPELDVPSAGFPSISADGLTIYFESDRSGGTEIYTSTRPTRETPFAAPTHFSDIDSPMTEDDADISRDGRRFLFGSGRSGGAGATDIYASTRTCL